jgi:hypothetical protein
VYRYSPPCSLPASICLSFSALGSEAALQEFRVDKEGSPVLLNCLMYKLCYYRFGEMFTEYGTRACASAYIPIFCLDLGTDGFTRRQAVRI